MIITTKRPYELLVRWREGVISGAHVGFELTTIEDGVVLSTTPLPVMPVNLGAGKGFPLADILKQIHTDALVGRDLAVFEKAALEAKHEALKKELADLKLTAALTAQKPAI